MAPDRCYWIKDEDGDEILIPMCHGSAVYGPYACTCTVPESRLEAAERRRDAAEEYVLQLREARDRRLDEQQRHWRYQKRLRQRIDELEAKLTAEAP